MALDPQAVALARAIRQVESGGNFGARGGSGEYGAYQFMPATWNSTAPKFGVNVPLEQATPEDQNRVAYSQIKEWKDQGWNVGEIASAWNAGAGNKDAYLKGNKGVNQYGVAYDTGAYAQKVRDAYKGMAMGTSPVTITPSTPVAQVAAPEERSVGGFARNVVRSGAGLLAGVGNAILNPIDTLKGIGSVAVGGLETVAGQETDNTANFDTLVNFFKDRYGSLEGVERTLYEDPLGFAADISTVFGGAGLATRAGSAGARAARAGQAADALGTATNVLNRASDLTNPLTPVARGAGNAINSGINAGANTVGRLAGFEPATMATIRSNPSDFTPQQIATVTREVVGNEVGEALNARLASLNETSAAYKPFRDSAATIDVSHNFLEDQLRNVAKLDIVDGQIVANSNSLIRNSAEVAKLQNVFNLYKPSFQAGKLTPAEFLNLRQDLANIAYNDLGKKSTDVARITDSMRANLNSTYRKNIEGLEAVDSDFSTQKKEFNDLKKGFIDKEGKLTDTAYSLIANATNKGNAQRLARLEQILPGITKKLEVLKAIEDIQKAVGNKVGTYDRSILETGGLVAGAASGSLPIAALSFASMIISEPARAVQLIKIAESIDPNLAPLVLSRLSRYATTGSILERATTAPLYGEQEGQAAETLLSQLSAPGSPAQSTEGTGGLESQDNTIEELATAANFDLAAARAEGYTDEEIAAFLKAASPQTQLTP